LNWLKRFLDSRRSYLEGPEPVRAFAPDPTLDCWPLSPEGTNDPVYDSIKTRGLELVSVDCGELVDLKAFGSGKLLFATTWETYSAQVIANLKRQVDSQTIGHFGIVFFEDTREQILVRKSKAWYFKSAYVLGPASAALREQVVHVPFLLTVDASEVVGVTAGLYCADQ
jgi:hypothetical protein